MNKSVLRATYHLCSASVIVALAGCSLPLGPPTSASAQLRLAKSVHGDATIRPLHNFGRGKDGYAPQGSLIYYEHKLYGTTQYGGVGGNGTVFEIRTTGEEHTLHSFAKPPDGSEPVSSLTALNTHLYGTTEDGGKYRMGTVFEISTGGAEKPIYSFGSGADGANPVANLIALNGKLYGTTRSGGKYAEGTVFSIDLNKHPPEQILHNFGSGNDGAFPDGGLTAIKDVLYGTTSAGGGPKSESHGAIFRITTSGSERVLLAFDCLDGAAPLAGLTEMNGTLYGTASQGGEACSAGNGDGTVFAFSSGSEENVVHPFAGGTTDGEDPVAPLVASRGKLYGTTYTAGLYGGGTVFSVTPGGDEVLLHSFGNGTDGNHPAGALIHLGKAYYGTTAGGGLYGGGIVYKLTF